MNAALIWTTTQRARSKQRAGMWTSLPVPRVSQTEVVVTAMERLVKVPGIAAPLTYVTGRSGATGRSERSRDADASRYCSRLGRQTSHCRFVPILHCPGRRRICRTCTAGSVDRSELRKRAGTPSWDALRLREEVFNQLPLRCKLHNALRDEELGRRRGLGGSCSTIPRPTEF